MKLLKIASLMLLSGLLLLPFNDAQAHRHHHGHVYYGPGYYYNNYPRHYYNNYYPRHYYGYRYYPRHYRQYYYPDYYYGYGYYGPPRVGLYFRF